MNLGAYFDKVKGVGVMATADAEGNVNAAALSKPVMMDENTVAFIMSGHLTHQNLTSNPKACYFFREQDGYDGKRLYLTKIKEEEGSELIETIRKKRYPIFTIKYNNESKYVVFFRVDKVLPLVADGVLRPGIREQG
ncbi:MAG: pyridoxamine 5'-phosphate oxidase family protein [Syntrophales bacterium]|jgi:hypothetical protein|nr:pyridoxamine 5'-phosphate oxidase family protein [Syntrophales bacterium]MCK9527092.1 pyridoxamine 5'-phosphate oxidase family protein [Syntrophales bacterium]MDX9921783.1 pyridoxamine 5'-phosphate oxidase family protein [Syntrophales bacterium]